MLIRSISDGRKFHIAFRLSYVPLIAPSTTLSRIKVLSSIADSFIYVVSKVTHFVRVVDMH